MAEQEQNHGQALQAGTVLHEFKIEKMLGEGGFGLTYLAFDTDLEKYVAIKEYLPIDFAIRSEGQTVIPRTESSKGDFNWGLQAFIKEARILAKFDHPNIVRINRFFQMHGTAYIAMEYVQGRTLTETLKDLEKLTQAEMLSLLAPLIDGLKHVHQQHYYHRDIKPNNIIVRDNGSPVLIDFGAARLAISGKSRSVTTMVTAGYAPIEQYSSKGKFGAWTDVYALAAVAYICLTAGRPDDAPDRVVDDELIPAVRAAAKQGSVEFLAAIDQGLAIHAADRPQTLEMWWGLLNRQEEIKVKKKVKPKKVPVVEESPEREEGSKKEAGKKLSKAIGILSVLVILGIGGFQVYEWNKQEIARLEEVEKLKEIARLEEAARQQAKQITEPITGMKLVYIEPGTFSMGSPSNEPERDSDETQHKVGITQGYYLGKYEVTQRQWKTLMGNNPSHFKACGDNCPVEQVSWNEVQIFIQKLNQQSSKTYRLPTEAEWEYAARAGTTTPFSLGDNISTEQVNYNGNYPYNGTKKGQYRQTPVVVGSLPANAWGLHEMHGNVYEWVSDGYVSDYYENSPAQDPQGRSGDSDRVIRGGSWGYDARGVRSANRSYDSPSYSSNRLGFRLARTF